MATTKPYQQTVSPIDALWALYQSQTKRVRRAFRSRLIAEEQKDKNIAEMREYEKNLSPDVHNAVCMMAVAVKQGAEEARQAAVSHKHVGRLADDFLAELEQDEACK